MVVKGGNVFCEDNHFHKKDIRIENNIIVGVFDEYIGDDKNIVDADGLFVIPGLVDIHSHGAIGYDFSDGNAEGLSKILEYEKSHGITSYCPTSMTMDCNTLLNIMSSAEKVSTTNNISLSRLVGINMEGPFLDPIKKGAHIGELIIDADIDFFDICNKKSGNRIKLVTLAPNNPTAEDFISKMKNKVNISLGHSSADYNTSKKAFDLGANHVTHLYNAMQPFEHRNPGLIGAAFDSENVVVELICDGIHVNESVVRATFQLFKGRVALISDSMRATGLNNGEYDLGGQNVFVNGNLATLKDGTIAGSVTNLFDCMKKAISFGISPEEAISSASSIPAKSIGLDKVGCIKESFFADLLLVDQNWNLIQII